MFIDLNILTSGSGDAERSSVLQRIEQAKTLGYDAVAINQMHTGKIGA